MRLIKIITMKELEELHDKKMIGKGTFTTGKYALEQGKPTFVAFNEE